MKQITMTQQTFEKSGKTTYKLKPQDNDGTFEISEQQYNNIVGDDTLRFFRRLGGSESATRGYTSCGYVITKLVSTSPDKSRRTIRTFKFEYVTVHSLE